MAGHSKWANIKRRKGAADAARGKLFSKLIKEIAVAAKMGGPDVDGNPRLRLAVDKAKGQSMPKATIERAIAKASGELGGADFETLTYEGYGPAGVAVLVECLTDNRNRTASDVKSTFSKAGGNLGEPGSVSYMFEKKGVFRLSAASASEDDVMLAALDAGGEDIARDGDEWVVTSDAASYDACKRALTELDETVSGEITQVAQTTVALDAANATKLMRLIDRLEELDDVQETHTNADIDDDVAATME